MISRLVRTEIESHLRDLIVWGGTVFFVLLLFLSFMGTLFVRTGRSATIAGDLTGLFLLSLALSSVLLALRVARRNASEKRTRLYSQLPASRWEVSFASWCVRLLYLWIPVLACTLVVARSADIALQRFALVALAGYFGATTLVAAISVALGIPHLPSRISAWAKGIYVTCAALAVVLWIGGNLFQLPSFPFPGIEDLTLPGLTGSLFVSALGLVVVDMWLRDHADDYLG